MRLKQIILAKIILTLVLWCGPLLIGPGWLYDMLGIPRPGEAVVFYRLLGAAYAALTVGYIAGLLRIRRGGPAAPTVIMGMVSNGLACIILAYYGFAGAWSAWPIFWGQIYMWGSMVLTAAITIGLFLGLLMPGDESGAKNAPA